jgi:cyclopropane-fatty-acyl-phospholipid synthase
MAEHYSVKVRAFNVSVEQIAYAREQVKSRGLGRLVEFVKEDYRAIRGSFDRFVSVGMLEHVGKSNLGEFGRVVARSIGKDGLGLIHSIGTNETRETNPWLSRRIFPGAYMPALSEMVRLVEAAKLSVWDVENLRAHYYLTLKSWYTNYEAAAERIVAAKGREFYLTWRLYLIGAMASFSSGNHQLFQLLVAPGGCSGQPLERRHLYEPAVTSENA